MQPAMPANKRIVSSRLCLEKVAPVFVAGHANGGGCKSVLFRRGLYPKANYAGSPVFNYNASPSSAALYHQQ